MIFNKLQGKLKIACVKAPGFGDNKDGHDAGHCHLCGARLVGEEGSGLELDAENFDPAILGTVKKATITKDDTVLLNGGGESSMVKERVELLRGLIDGETSDYNREKLQERLAKLSGGVAVIKVGGGSEVEVNEKKDRITDALCSTAPPCRRALFPVVVWRCCARSKALDSLLGDSSLTADQRTGVQIIRNAVRLPRTQSC
ncbi:hypothetical protein TcBrA4_0017090 [Trypanosoma cruzi]|nr:hypothetical protein TcBrA4_0017090 [Trypanosoma cruzi]